MEWQSLNHLVDKLFEHHLFLKGITAVIASLSILLLARLVEAGVAKKVEDKDIRYKARKSINLLSYVVILIVVMTIFSEQMTNLAVIIGALSVGIGFALRELIQSLLGWMAISLWGMYKIGERIQMGGVMGDIIDISPLTTTVMECGGWVKADLYTGRVVSLSNSLIFKEHIINYTANFSFLWDEIVIPVSLDSDHKMARQLINAVAHQVLDSVNRQNQHAWIAYSQQHLVDEVSCEPAVTMSFDANWIEFTLRYVVDHRQRRVVKDRLFTHILEQVAQTQGKVVIASSNMRISLNQEPVFDVANSVDEFGGKL